MVYAAYAITLLCIVQIAASLALDRPLLAIVGVIGVGVFLSVAAIHTWRPPTESKKDDKDEISF